MTAVIGNHTFLDGLELQDLDTALASFNRTSVDNTETPTPTPVGYHQRHYSPEYDFNTENAAIYCRIDHRGSGFTDFRYWFYGEIVDQSLVGGAMTKVIHRGAGDAHYVAVIGDNTSGYGYESAMFGGWQDPPTDTIPKQENGFLASFQGAGGFQESVKNQSNSVCYHALVHDDGSDPTNPTPWATNYGLFFANNSLSNAFVARVSEYALNYSQFKLMDHTAAQRPIWEVFADGQQWHNAEEATAVDTLRSPSPLIFRGYYWTGAVEQANQTQLSHQVTGAGGGIFRVDIGNPGFETLALQVGETGNAAVAGWMKVGSGSLVQSDADGDIVLTDSVGSDFNLLKFGGSTNAFPALLKSSTALYVVKADNSAYAVIGAARFYGQDTSGTQPSLVPYLSDTDTGIGRAGPDELSLIAGGAELMNLKQNDAAIDEITTNCRWNMITPTSSIPLLIRGSGNGARIQLEDSVSRLHGFMGSLDGLVTGVPGDTIGMRSEEGIGFATNGNNIQVLLDTGGRMAIGGSTPDTSSQLDLQRTDGALTLPRLTTTERNALTPVNGMMIYNVTDGKFQGYEGGAWTNLI